MNTNYTLADLARRMNEAAAVLDKYTDLPTLRGVFVYEAYVSLAGMNTYIDPWQAALDLAAWADKFGVTCKVVTSYSGDGSITIEFEEDGLTFRMSSNLGTAHAYELGAVLRQKLTRDKPLMLSAQRLAEVARGIQAEASK